MGQETEGDEDGILHAGQTMSVNKPDEEQVARVTPTDRNHTKRLSFLIHPEAEIKASG